MIDRSVDRKLVQAALKRSRIVALLGPRQCGKTTLAREFLAADSLNYFDLEDPSSLARLDEPDTALRPLKNLVVIDEIQRRPDLFPLLRHWLRGGFPLSVTARTEADSVMWRRQFLQRSAAYSSWNEPEERP